jgi:hypothetical protein
MRSYGIDTVHQSVPGTSCHPLSSKTHPSQSEVLEDTPSLATHHTPVLDLGGACIAVHLREL